MKVIVDVYTIEYSVTASSSPRLMHGLLVMGNVGDRSVVDGITPTVDGMTSGVDVNTSTVVGSSVPNTVLLHVPLAEGSQGSDTVMVEMVSFRLGASGRVVNVTLSESVVESSVVGGCVVVGEDPVNGKVEVEVVASV